VPVNPFAREVAHIVLPVAAKYGFAVAGGTALIEHGIVDRLTEDLDVFSPREDGVEAAADVVEAALRAEGLHVERRDNLAELAEEFPEWDVEDLGTGLGEWLITAPSGEQMVLQMSCFPRSRAPVIIDAVPVLHVEDAVGLKCHAFCTRIEPRDAFDMAMALGRWSVDDLIGFAQRVQPSLLAEEFAEAGQNLDATPDDRFVRLGLTADDIALIRERLSAWPRDPSQVPAARDPAPSDIPVRSGRYARPRRYPSGGAAPRRDPGR
jgi:hypothetical protein